MKSGQLIEYNVRKNFLEKTYTKCGGEPIPRPFSKKSKLRISLDYHCNLFIQFVFIVCQAGCHQNILKLSRKHLAFTSYKTFFKNKRRSGTSSPVSFSA